VLLTREAAGLGLLLLAAAGLVRLVRPFIRRLRLPALAADPLPDLTERLLPVRRLPRLKRRLRLDEPITPR
jgi:hypothetical protein